MKKTIYYKDFSSDVFENKNQDYKIPEDYVWIKKNLKYRFLSAVSYGIAWAFGWIYCVLFLHMRIKNRKVMRGVKNSGFFIYANHTQLVGDVFIPACVCGTKRIFTVVSQANMGLPVIGKIIPYIGALPIPDGLSRMRLFMAAVKQRIEEKHPVIIYPEAHIWPYYTDIRPFPDTSFYFPTVKQTPVFSMTVTYRKRRIGKRPKTVVYIDGPFMPDTDLVRKQQQKKLRDQVAAAMSKRAENSTYKYIDYRKEDNT